MVPSSETQGQLVGTGKSLKWTKKNSGKEIKSQERKEEPLGTMFSGGQTQFSSAYA